MECIPLLKGIFIAKISKGRTVREFIEATLFYPSVFSLTWMVIFGGTSIRIERAAAGENLCCNNGQGTIYQGIVLLYCK